MTNQSAPNNYFDVATVKEHLSYDPDSGVVRWSKVPPYCRNVSVGDVAGCLHKSSGYLVIRLKNHGLAAHRVAWLLSSGGWPAGVIDHINGNKTDNRIKNLRDTNRSVNSQNQRHAHSGNKGGLIGANFHKRIGKWAASIRVLGKGIHIGYFDSAEKAHAAYVEKKREIHEGNTL